VSATPAAAMTVPQLDDGRLLLTEWREDDLPTLLAVTGDPAIRRYSSLGAVRTMPELVEWVATRRAAGRLDWAVRDAASEALLGRVGLMNLHLDDHLGEIGYWTLPAARRRGVAATAVGLVTRYGFDVLGRHRLEICHEPGNVGSCQVAVRNGYVVEGIMREVHHRYDGRFSDLEMHARLATDHEPAMP
jgi:RimJ/RimL family protein N-acetyltransferase